MDNKIAVEENKDELVATVYSHNYQIKRNPELVENSHSFEVNILKRLWEVVDLEEQAEDIVTAEYIISKLELNKADKRLIEESTSFEIIKFPVMDIPRIINDWKRADNIVDYRFGNKEEKRRIIENKGTLEVDVTKGMVRILPMLDWGEVGGVYAIKLMSDTERRTEIKIILKYEEEGEYVYSEFISIKQSELVYAFEGEAEMIKHVGKLKKLMDYSPAGKEALDYRKLFLALCIFNDQITTRMVRSDKLNFADTYKLLVKNAYELANGGVGEEIFGEGYYILSKDELSEIANKAGYTIKELVVLLKERGLLETDKDKMTRNQKTISRNGVKGKYYCIITSKRFNKQCETESDMLSISEENYGRLNNKYEKLIDKKRKSNDAVRECRNEG